MRVEVIDRLKLGARREISRALPVLKPQLTLVAYDLVFAHRRLDDAAMAQITSHALGVLYEMGERRAHAGETTNGHEWTRMDTNKERSAAVSERPAAACQMQQDRAT